MTTLTDEQAELCETSPTDCSDLEAFFSHCTLKRGPERSHTQGIDHSIATGVWPDMTEHGWEHDDWPEAGLAQFAIATALLASPSTMVDIWPWMLTPLAAATLGAWFALPGVTALMMGIDGRWSAIRITLESQLIGLALILLATARAWEQFDKSNALTYVFAGGIALLLVGLATLWTPMVLRRLHAP
jgi:hypothetical protein